MFTAKILVMEMFRNSSLGNNGKTISLSSHNSASMVPVAENPISLCGGVDGDSGIETQVNSRALST